MWGENQREIWRGQSGGSPRQGPPSTQDRPFGPVPLLISWAQAGPNSIRVSPYIFADISRIDVGSENQLFPGRDADGVDHVARIKPAQDFGDMAFDRLLVATQFLRDLPVGKTF